MGHSVVAVPQGSPLSSVLFLVWLAPILKEMEWRIVEVVPGVGEEFPSYVDDLHCSLYDERIVSRSLDGEERTEAMMEMVDTVSMVVKEVAAECDLPLAENT